MMKMEQIMKTIEELSRSQGVYGVIYRWLTLMKTEDPDLYAKTVETLEAEHFESAVDVALFFET